MFLSTCTLMFSSKIVFKRNVMSSTISTFPYLRESKGDELSEYLGCLLPFFSYIVLYALPVKLYSSALMFF